MPRRGDLVLTTPSPECLNRWCKLQPYGSTGEVVMLLEEFKGDGQPTDNGDVDGHRVFVIVSTDAEGRMEGGWYAVAELTPLPDTACHERNGEREDTAGGAHA
jgi:hypothetical protein